jgi:hypothetical protein
MMQCGNCAKESAAGKRKKVITIFTRIAEGWWAAWNVKHSFQSKKKLTLWCRSTHPTPTYMSWYILNIMTTQWSRSSVFPACCEDQQRAFLLTVLTFPACFDRSCTFLFCPTLLGSFSFY